MPFFRKPYKSEVSIFIDELKARKPSLEAEQRAGRALLWDRPVDRQAQAAWDEARVPQQPYVYQTNESSEAGVERRPPPKGVESSGKATSTQAS